MNEGNVLLVLAVVSLAFLLAVPGAIAFVRSLSVGRGEVDLFQRVRALEAEVEALRRELALVRADRDRVQTELAAAKARIGELEDLMAAYQTVGVGGTGRTSRTRTGHGPTRTGMDAGEGQSERRAEVLAQLQIVEGQVTAAGGEKRAPAELVAHRNELAREVRRLEQELDGAG